MSGQAHHDSSPGLEDGALVDGTEPSTEGTRETTPIEPREAAARTPVIARFAGRTAVGQVREHNEDNLVIANLTTGEIRPRDELIEDEIGDRGMLFSVCDGMGGAAAGEVASQMAVDILVEAMGRGGPPKNRDALARRLVQAVEEAGRRIFQAAQKERSRRGMGTTTTAAVLIDKVLFLGEVGDSRGYLLRRGQLKQITKDQSLVNQLIEAGHLTEDEAEAFEHSNIILQALGTAETVNVDLTFVELRRGDRLMLCSDGLSGLVHFETLRATLDEVRNPVDCCSKLIELAEAGGGHDNITCIVVDFEGELLALPDETASFGYMQYPLPLSDEDSTAFADEDTAGGPVRLSEDDPSSAPTQRPASPEPMTRDEQDRSEDSRESALWILAGALALIGALGVWWTLDPKARNEQQAVALPAVAAKEEAPIVAPVAAEAPSEDVQVNVYTDVPEATLLVNGESQGPVSALQSKGLKLKPGAYRFEAQVDSNSIAVTVVTVRGDMPMDVFLKAPAPGSVPAAAAHQKAEDQENEPGVPEEAEEPAPTKPQALPAQPSEATDRRASPVQAEPAQPKTVEPKTVEPKTVEPKTVEPKTVEPKTVEPKAVEPKPAPVEAKPAEPAPTPAPRRRPSAAEGASPTPTPDLPSNPF